MTARQTTLAGPSRIIDGVEFYDMGSGLEVQCARCGSSVMSEYIEESIDGSWGGGVVHTCLSSAEWCAAHPLPGREEHKGAGQ